MKLNEASCGQYWKCHNQSLQQCRMVYGVESCRDVKTNQHSGMLIVSGSVNTVQNVEQGRSWWNDLEGRQTAVWEVYKTG